MNLKDIYNKGLNISYEVFPPKNEEQYTELYLELEKLKNFNPAFVSLTWGASGSCNSSETLIKKISDLDFDIMPHFTCVCSSKTFVNSHLSLLESLKIDKILALRGDFPEDTSKICEDFKFANELVDYIKANSDLSVGVAGYPEGHIEAPSLKDDIKNLKIKVQAGADAIFTQLFFDNDKFHKYIDLLKHENINIPVIPGIMPIISKKQIEKMTSMAKITIPNSIQTAIEKYGNDNSDMQKFGIEYGIKQCENLIKSGVLGLHFYTLNRSYSTGEILKELL